MTALDTIFNNSAKAVGLAWFIVEDVPDRTQHASKQYKFPCIWRNFNESITPLFDNGQRVEREMSLYFVQIGFSKLTKETINENIEDLMTKYIAFKDLMNRAGVELSFNGKPFPNWKQTNYDEYGLVINLTARYSLCLT